MYLLRLSTALKMHRLTVAVAICLTVFASANVEGASPSSIEISVPETGQQWHPITIDVTGPSASESDTSSNPFLDYRYEVTWTHAPTSTKYITLGYFAADGDAANTSADSGNIWRSHFAPDRTGQWSYSIHFVSGEHVAIDRDREGEPIADLDGVEGMVMVTASQAKLPSLRARGRLQYVGKRYLRFAGDQTYFLKAGADAPETLLGYADFDNTVALKKNVPLKTFSAHVQDWQSGDPTWGGQGTQGGRGKGLIGAINYLSSKGCNAFSFLTYNAGGDGDNVWPFVDRDDPLHYDCSKLDQWGVVFEHGTHRGMYLHFKMQETENDDQRHGKKGSSQVPTALDGGDLGVERKLYCRELIARYSHHLALNWNLGEENTQSHQQRQAMQQYIAEMDPYDHAIVMHTFPDQQRSGYEPFLGDANGLTGLSLQNSGIQDTHWQTAYWVDESTKSGHPWVVAFDESGSAAHGQCPDLGYRGYDGHDNSGKMTYTSNEVRKQTLWGTLMGGGAGVEYYFGYKYAENDLVCEDWRSRDQSWEDCNTAIRFFHDHSIPFWRMSNRDEWAGNEDHDNSVYCMATESDDASPTVLVYCPDASVPEVDLSSMHGTFDVRWFDPRSGGDLQAGSVASVDANVSVDLGAPPNSAEPADDWLIVLQSTN
ncbi:MAG: DUF5060 domain-containing protein [Planctomycetota bacterium]